MKFGLVQKMVWGISIVSLVTFGTSACFIFLLKPYLAPHMTDWLYIALILFLGILWTSFLGWIAARYMIRPLVQLTQAVNEAATGNLNVPIPVYKPQDEIQQLNRSFQTMTANLRQMIADISHNASFADQSAHALSAAISHATNQIESISTTVDQIAAGTATQAHAAQVLFRSVEQAAHAAEEMDTEADRAIVLSNTSMQTVESSSETLHTLVESMNTISAGSAEALDIVRRLERHTEEIGQVSALVGEIADQTQLLALNASIEAARAGEHGLGFAVVAAEIRKLAEHSSDAVERIHQRVQQMQEQAKQAVTEITSQVAHVHQEASKGDAAAKALDHIASSARKTAASLEHIVSLVASQTGHIRQTFGEAKQITAVTQQISDSTSRMSEATQEQTAVMQQLTAASEQLRAEADDLKRKTVVFRL